LQHLRGTQKIVALDDERGFAESEHALDGLDERGFDLPSTPRAYPLT
jgi:hypothetical protein